MSLDFPEVVGRSGARSARVLDVRAVLGKGGDPFTLIMSTTRDLADDEALLLVVGFEPTPLYAVMRGLGRAAHTERSNGAYQVWFYRDGTAEKRAPAGSAAAEPASLQPPVEMDVRGLEPPQPMIRILEKLIELGPGAQLLVRHHREPVLLYEKLAARGYTARCTQRGAGDFIVHVAPAGTFDEDR